MSRVEKVKYRFMGMVHLLIAPAAKPDTIGRSAKK
jgi:hypothetical protein